MSTRMEPDHISDETATIKGASIDVYYDCRLPTHEGRIQKISLEKGTLGIISKNGKFLLGKRANRPYKGLWCAFGGKVEKGETPEKALKRELFEELGIKIMNPELV